LNGAVPQKSTPEHIKKERKVEVTTPSSIAKNNADKLKKSLKLNDSQYNDLHAALIDYEVAVDKTTKSKMSKQDQFKKLNELNLKRQNKLKTILTEEQFHSYIMSFP
jgi:hypothetical protein